MAIVSHRGLLCSLMLLMAMGTAAHAQSVEGVWTGTDGKLYRFVHDASSGRVELRVSWHTVRNDMVFRGNFRATGFELEARLNGVHNISTVIPLAVRQEALRRHPDITYVYELRDIAPDRMTLINHFHSITHGSGGFERINFRESSESIVLTRGSGFSDLEVVAFACNPTSRREGTETREYFEVTARVRNSGDVDLTEATAVRLLQGAATVGSFTLPAVEKGGEVSLYWTSDERSTDPRHAAISEDGTELKLVVDSDAKVDEVHEHNNEMSLYRLTCEDPDDSDVSPLETLWVDVAPERDGTPPDYTAFLARRSGATVEQKARAVLCYIRLEAQRRARLQNMTVAGSQFIANLMKHYLGEYLAVPTPENGEEAADMLGDAQGLESVGMSKGLYVPKRLREAHPSLPEWIYPATQFWNARQYRGEGAGKLPLIDVPFLVGENASATAGMADALKGGRNLSQVMHWATAVYYSHIPQDAFRELFIGYEYWHLEAWDIFGEDPINDLIAEEQGRLLGQRLKAGSIKSEIDLIHKMDADFRTARRWVGAMIYHRRKELDTMILAESAPKANMHWGVLKQHYSRPWLRVSIKQALAAGVPLDAVIESALVEHIVRIYTLLYEGKGEPLTPLTREILDGKYNKQFEDAVKSGAAEWEIE